MKSLYKCGGAIPRFVGLATGHPGNGRLIVSALSDELGMEEAAEWANDIVQAVNSYDANQETIKLLVAACEAAMEVEPNNCSYDHHGLCQAHNLQPKEKCWHELCVAALAAAQPQGEISDDT